MTAKGYSLLEVNYSFKEDLFPQGSKYIPVNVLAAPRDLSRLVDKNAFTVLHYPEDSFSQTGAFTKQFSVYKYLSWRITERLDSQVWNSFARCFLLRMDWHVSNQRHYQTPLQYC